MNLERVVYLGRINQAEEVKRDLEILPKDYKPFPDFNGTLCINVRIDGDRKNRVTNIHPSSLCDGDYRGEVLYPDGAKNIKTRANPGSPEEKGVSTEIGSFTYKEKKFRLHRNSKEFMAYFIVVST